MQKHINYIGELITNNESKRIYTVYRGREHRYIAIIVELRTI